ncbi:MAG: DUF5131 family protein [Verrucomicrobiota bacterium]
MGRTAIEWTDVTDNIIVAARGGWWCRKKSPACRRCYAERLNQSAFFGGNGLKYTGKPPKLELRRDILESWARARIPRKRFVASMTDVFGEWVPDGWCMEFLDAMAAAPQQTFLLLTKRADVMRYQFQMWLFLTNRQRVPSNIWPGATVERQIEAEERLPALCAIPSDVHWISAEPLIGPLDLDRWELDWVVTGGESGPGSEASRADDFRHLRDQCVRRGIRFFFKQWGDHDCRGRRVGKKRAGRRLDGRLWNQWPEITATE